MYNKYFKRAFDVLVSAAALLILSPIYALIAILVRVKLGSPIIFVQQRPGKDGKVFRLYKFRTMTDARDEIGVLLADEFRMTPSVRAEKDTSESVPPSGVTLRIKRRWRQVTPITLLRQRRNFLTF